MTPRYDDLIIYLVPADLYTDILSALGLPYAALICTAAARKLYANLSGGEAKNLLDLLNQPGSDRCERLAAELYRWLEVGEPSADSVPLQEVE